MKMNMINRRKRRKEGTHKKDYLKVIIDLKSLKKIDINMQ